MFCRSLRLVVLLTVCAGTLAGLAGLILIAPRGTSAQDSGARGLPTTPLAIRTGDGRLHRFKVEVAANSEQRTQGLMFRRTLAPDAGMLFDFGETRPIAMWMKNTFIPLDMIFIAADGMIVNIAQRTVPHSLAAIPSQKPVRGVLEVNGGTAARLGLKPGDRVLHPVFGSKAP